MQNVDAYNKPQLMESRKNTYNNDAKLELVSPLLHVTSTVDTK